MNEKISDVDLAFGNPPSLKLIRIYLSVISLERKLYIKIEIQDCASAVLTALNRLEAHCHVVLSNALSHERLTPLNKILNLSQQIKDTKNLDSRAL